LCVLAHEDFLFANTANRGWSVVYVVLVIAACLAISALAKP